MNWYLCEKVAFIPVLNEVIHHMPELRVVAGKRPGLGIFFFLNSKHLELGELVDVSLPPKFQIDGVELKLRMYPTVRWLVA